MALQFRKSFAEQSGIAGLLDEGVDVIRAQRTPAHPVLERKELPIGTTPTFEGGHHIGHRFVSCLEYTFEGPFCRIVKTEPIAFDAYVRA